MPMSADFDKAIDRAVREMLDVEPPADLRAKVVARIDELPASGFRLPVFGFRRFGVLVGAAAVLVIAIAISRLSGPSSVAPVTSVAGADTNLAADIPGAGSVRERLPATSQTPIVAVTRPARATTRAADVVIAASLNEPDSATTEISPLQQMTPIDVEPITQRSIAPEPLGVRPLNPITEVQIAPLNPPDRRN